MGQVRNWTIEEAFYLMDNWGVKSLKTICKTLSRSENAVRIKVKRLGLGSFLESGEYVTFNQLIIALGKGGNYNYKMTSWVEKRGFPLKSKRVNNCSFRVVYLDDFWKWLKDNRDFVDLSRFEENSLGEEPDWLKEQRRHDYARSMKYKRTPWTPAEDDRLRHLIDQYKYTYLELSQILGRTSGAIQRRLCDLGIKGRPVKPDNHIKWTDDEYALLREMINNGVSYDIAAERLGKSSKAIRGRVYALYGTENLDKVRQNWYLGG